jgi:hypothetical protein
MECSDLRLFLAVASQGLSGATTYKLGQKSERWWRETFARSDVFYPISARCE